MGKHSMPEDEKKSKKRAKKKEKIDLQDEDKQKETKSRANKKKEIIDDNEFIDRDSTEAKRNRMGKNIKKKKKHTILRRVLLIVLIILIVAVVFLGIKISQNGGGMKGVVTTFIGSSAEEVQKLDDLYVLCMGKSQNMTDTIMVAKYSPNKQQVSLLSIPRDSFVGKSRDSASAYDKINAKYQTNPQATIDAVNELTGLNVKYYVTVDTKALRDLVDALGGIEFDVPIDMDYDDPTQDLEIHLEKGLQTLNGMQAEGVVRFRHNNDGTSYPTEYGDNDIGRMRTQRAFIETVMKETMKASNITKVNQLLNIAKDEVETNLSWDIIKNYIIALLDFDTSNLQTDSLPGKPQFFNELSFFVVDKTAARQKVEEMFLTEQTDESTEEDDDESNTTNTTSSKSTTKTTSNSSISIELINGTGSNARFADAQEQLKNRGFKVNKKGTTNVTQKTLIINRNSVSSDIESEIKSLLCTGAITSGEEDDDIDITIIIGTDY